MSLDYTNLKNALIAKFAKVSDKTITIRESATADDVKYPTEKAVRIELNKKQDTLVGSGTGQNIKTVGGVSILGAGDVPVASDYDSLTNRPQVNSVTLTGNKSLSDLGANISIDTTTTTTGMLKSYTFKQGTSTIGTVDIPKDYLVKSASVKTCTVPDTPISGLVVGDKYIDFTVNSKDGSGTESHLYVAVKDMGVVYKADGSTLELGADNTFKVKDAGIDTVQLKDGSVTKLKINQDFIDELATAIESIT